MEEMIEAKDLCTFYNIDYSFINSLSECGLVEVTIIEERRFIPQNELPKFEKLLRLHSDLDINVEGLEAISNLLQTIETMQNEMNYLRNRLRVFERRING